MRGHPTAHRTRPNPEGARPVNNPTQPNLHCQTQVHDLRTGVTLYACDNPNWLHRGDHHDPRTGQHWTYTALRNFIVRGAAA